MSAALPQIGIEVNEDGQYMLVATSYGVTEPAGERLFKSQPFPDIHFLHDEYERAKIDAEKLQQYINEKWAAKAASKSKAKKHRTLDIGKGSSGL